MPKLLKQLTDSDQMIGKTVKSVWTGDEKYIAFTDRSFIVIAPVEEHGVNYIVVLGPQENNIPNPYALRQLGLITEEEETKMRQDREKRLAKIREDRDRELYEMLKERFG